MTVVRRADVVEAPMTVRDVESLVILQPRGRGGHVLRRRPRPRPRTLRRAPEYEGHPTGCRPCSPRSREEVAERTTSSRSPSCTAWGRCRSGDSALVAAVSAAHRGEAFKACADLVDEIKHRLPVWKHQVFTDGTDEWVNCA